LGSKVFPIQSYYRAGNRWLRDAALYITKLPKEEHDVEEWQAAMEALMLVAECDGPDDVRSVPGIGSTTRVKSEPPSRSHGRL
jgi:hypothetical protein